MNTFLKYYATILLSITIGINSYAQDANNILEELNSKTNSYENIKATFSYKMLNKEAGIDESTNGTLMVEGDKYNLNIAGQIVISDG